METTGAVADGSIVDDALDEGGLDTVMTLVDASTVMTHEDAMIDTDVDVIKQ